MQIRGCLLRAIMMGLLPLLANVPVSAAPPAAGSRLQFVHSYELGLSRADAVSNGVRDAFAPNADEIQGSAEYLEARRILNGESGDYLPVVKARDGDRIMFAYGQLERFAIPLSELPGDARFLNRPDAVYQDNRSLVWAM